MNKRHTYPDLELRRRAVWKVFMATQKKLILDAFNEGFEITTAAIERDKAAERDPRNTPS